jgi:hypothetical protein
MYVTYLLLNFGTVFPGGLAYFAPQKSFHINSKGKSPPLEQWFPKWAVPPPEGVGGII